MENCIFCKIAKREIPKEFTYEDDEVMVFSDIHPIKPIHLLIIPKKHIGEFLEVENSELFHKLFSVVQKMVKEQGLTDKGYRISINGGGAQLINHLHIHLFGPLGKTATM
jgi:histidine triad (HIT) family protein